MVKNGSKLWKNSYHILRINWDSNWEREWRRWHQIANIHGISVGFDVSVTDKNKSKMKREKRLFKTFGHTHPFATLSSISFLTSRFAWLAMLHFVRANLTIRWAPTHWAPSKRKWCHCTKLALIRLKKLFQYQLRW